MMYVCLCCLNLPLPSLSIHFSYPLQDVTYTPPSQSSFIQCSTRALVGPCGSPCCPSPSIEHLNHCWPPSPCSINCFMQNACFVQSVKLKFYHFEISKNHKKTHLMLVGCYWEKLLCCNVCSTSSMLMWEAQEIWTLKVWSAFEHFLSLHFFTYVALGILFSFWFGFKGVRVGGGRNKKETWKVSNLQFGLRQ
jgi:hypothetical protein